MTKNIRPIRTDGQLAYVQLTKGFTATIDASNIHIVEGFNWTALPARNTTYAYRRRRNGSKSTMVLMHREILQTPNGLLTDHIDGDGLNNRFSNLRAVNQSQNSCNVGRRSGGRSRFKGVCWHSEANKWVAQITKNYKRHYLGLFETEEDAYIAYKIAAKRLHGPYSKT